MKEAFRPPRVSQIVLISVICSTIAGFFAGGIAYSYLGNQGGSLLSSRGGQISQIDISREESAITNLVQETSPSVVSISISRNVPSGGFNPFDIFWGNDGRIETREREVGGGTGFIVSKDGFIMTNKHVVNDADGKYTVIFNDGERVAGELVALHPTQDLAILKINKSGLQPLTFAESDDILVGQTVIAIGNALTEFDNTVSRGVVSGLRRSIVASDQVGNSEELSNIIQTDAAINPGNSGGPLLDINGRVIGVNVALAQGAQNIGFAIPSNVAYRMLQDVSEFGEVRAAFMGIRYQMIEPNTQLSQELGVGNGVFVSSTEGPAVLADSPAALAGIKTGDVITRIDDQEITVRNSLIDILTKYRPGDTIELDVIRDGAELTLNLTLDIRPNQP